VHLLGHGELKSKLAFEVTGASRSAIKAVEAAGGTVTLKSITGRETPAADAIKAKRRAEKREALAAKSKGKSGKAAKAEGEAPAGADEAKPAKAAKAKSGLAEEAAGKAPKKEKTAEAEDKKSKPQAGKKDKS
jgi:hypothetical protein